MRVRAQLWAALLASLVLLLAAQFARAAVTTPPSTYYLSGLEGDPSAVNIRAPSWTFGASYSVGDLVSLEVGKWGVFAVCPLADYPDWDFTAGVCQITATDAGGSGPPFSFTAPVPVEVWLIPNQICPYQTGFCQLHGEPDFVPPADGPASAASGAPATEATVSEAVTWLSSLFWLGVTALGFFGYSVGARDA